MKVYQSPQMLTLDSFQLCSVSGNRPLPYFGKACLACLQHWEIFRQAVYLPRIWLCMVIVSQCLPFLNADCIWETLFWMFQWAHRVASGRCVVCGVWCVVPYVCVCVHACLVCVMCVCACVVCVYVYGMCVYVHVFVSVWDSRCVGGSTCVQVVSSPTKVTNNAHWWFYWLSVFPGCGFHGYQRKEPCSSRSALPQVCVHTWLWAPAVGRNCRQHWVWWKCTVINVNSN